ncbi:TetR/AcrR family transcriptional regulator [Sphaerisporangium sp. TRM90804]|uniref:TetR/AcrR family transcriptional regulator n=1 Tax=Sphaerisporangium sp. TRM90804 TaxID=3031113 RepID=UPI00244D247C|nr:TetR/AcrR family transcriptional regulator [Sphaerisporangium sp. TRM90804]MDH2429980.1 TetR/AcrR family transcriptional regulator [Sphaerisporangium sp. TRM90804]
MATGRDYRGMTAEQRLADRRQRLLTAAYTLFAVAGFTSTTIERLCAAARISNRAFYECFSGREDLMRAVYDRCVEETMLAVSKAIGQAPPDADSRIKAGISEYIAFVTRDTRRARIMHLEVRRSGDILTAHRQRAVSGFTDIIEDTLGELEGALPGRTHLMALGMVGAIQELLIEWVLAENPPPLEHLTETAVHIFRRSFGSEPAYPGSKGSTSL